MYAAGLRFHQIGEFLALVNRQRQEWGLGPEDRLGWVRL
jgi:hypothetical protein